MTNAEVSAQFEIVHPRLENLTSYVGASSLLHIPTRRAPAGFPQLVAASRTPQKYDAATRAGAAVTEGPSATSATRRAAGGTPTTTTTAANSPIRAGAARFGPALASTRARLASGRVG